MTRPPTTPNLAMGPQQPTGPRDRQGSSETHAPTTSRRRSGLCAQFWFATFDPTQFAIARGPGSTSIRPDLARDAPRWRRGSRHSRRAPPATAEER